MLFTDSFRAKRSRTAGAGMLFDKSPKLRVTALSDLVILHPNREDRDPDDVISGVVTRPTTNGSLVEGKVVLTLPAPRKVDKLRVELIGKQTVWLKPAFETYDSIHHTAELDTGTQVLSAGEHSFGFTFTVPDNSAAFDNSLYGRTYHRLVATAPGLGKFNTDLTAETVLFVISNHSDSGGIPPGFNMESESHHDILGPIGVTLTSKYLLVSGYLRLSLIMPSIAQPIEINDIRVVLVQRFTLNSLKKPRPDSDELHPIVNVPLWTLRKSGNWKGTPILQTHDELSIIEQFRLPDDEKIRPSTAEGASTGVRVQHELAVCIYYTPLLNNPEKHRREKKLSTPATLSSCCCIFDALQLPAYSSSSSDDESTYIDKDAIGFCSGCLCKISASSNFSSYGFTSDELDSALKSKTRPAWKEDELYEKEWQAHHNGVLIHTGQSTPYSSDTERSPRAPLQRTWQVRPSPRN